VGSFGSRTVLTSPGKYQLKNKHFRLNRINIETSIIGKNDKNVTIDEQNFQQQLLIL